MLSPFDPSPLTAVSLAELKATQKAQHATAAEKRLLLARFIEMTEGVGRLLP